MNYITVFLLIQMFTGVALKGGHVDCQNNNIPDFFAQPNLLTPRVIEISLPPPPGFKVLRFPGFYYDTKHGGMARIICFPKDTALWTKTLRKLTTNTHGRLIIGHDEKAAPYIKGIREDTGKQQLFDIYALYADEKNIFLESDLTSKVRTIHFPCLISIYYKTKSGWVLKEKRVFKSWKEYVRFKI